MLPLNGRWQNRTKAFQRSSSKLGMTQWKATAAQPRMHSSLSFVKLVETGGRFLAAYIVLFIYMFKKQIYIYIICMFFCSCGIIKLQTPKQLNRKTFGMQITQIYFPCPSPIVLQIQDSGVNHTLKIWNRRRKEKNGLLGYYLLACQLPDCIYIYMLHLYNHFTWSNRDLSKVGALGINSFNSMVATRT